jgi:hypothetical protein
MDPSRRFSEASRKAISTRCSPSTIRKRLSDSVGRGEKRGEALRRELVPFAQVKTPFDFEVMQVIQSGDIAR